PRQLARRGEPRRPRTHDRDPFPGRLAGAEQRRARADRPVRRVALQVADANRPLVGVVDAGAFAELFGRADARAARADGIRLHDRARAAEQIAGRDAPDEARYVDPGRTRARARRVVAVEAAIRLDRYVERRKPFRERRS